MNYRRKDILELSYEALIALSNAGFVKKAAKELEAGQRPDLEEDADGNLTGTFKDGTRSILPAGRTLKEASCSCPAGTICRHRVALVLAYQMDAAAAGNGQSADEMEAYWSPGDFDDALLAESIPRGKIDQAQKLAADQPLATVLQWKAQQVPTVKLSMCTVRFFSRSSLAHARCDCREGSGCQHIPLAVWAFRQAAVEQPDRDEAVLQIRLPGEPSTDRAETEQERIFANPAAAALVEEITEWLEQLWNLGATQPLSASEAVVSRILRRCNELGWCWVEEGVSEIWELLRGLHNRSSRFSERELLNAVVNLTARFSAAAQMETVPSAQLPPRQILGVGEKGEVALDHLNLTALGLDLWEDDGGQGAVLILIDQDTQTLMQLEQYWPQPESQPASPAWEEFMARRISGRPLKQMANSQIITKGATRKANGRVEITTGNRYTNLFPLSPQSWDNIRPPVRFDTPAELIGRLNSQPPVFARPAQPLDQFHVITLQTPQILQWGWDGAKQVLHAVIQSGQDKAETLRIAIPHNPLAPKAIDAAAEVLSGVLGEIRHLAGNTRLEGGTLHIQPMAMVTEQRTVILHATDAKPGKSAFQPMQMDTGAVLATIDSVLGTVAYWLRCGLRNTGKTEIARGRDLQRSLAGCGLQRCASVLGDLMEEMSRPGSRLSRRLTLFVLVLEEVAGAEMSRVRG